MLQDFRVDLTISARVDNQLRRSHVHRLHGAIIGWDAESDEDEVEDVTIGEIIAWKISWLKARDLVCSADAISSDCVQGFEWFLKFNQTLKFPLFDDEETDSVFDLLWIEDVEIFPKYRGHYANALKCVATFLDLAGCETVFARCGFDEDSRNKARLAKLWAKLGFDLHDDHLWRSSWQSPEWLRGDLDLFDIY